MQEQYHRKYLIQLAKFIAAITTIVSFYVTLGILSVSALHTADKENDKPTLIASKSEKISVEVN